MSFFCNNTGDSTACIPGLIKGNATNGLCEKVCIQVKKVFDACLSREQITDKSIVVTDLTPPLPTYPLTFVSARTSTSEGVITNLKITSTSAENNCSRVRAEITVPLNVVYVDANDVEGVGVSSLTVTRDVILFVPNASVFPYKVEAVVSFIATDGEYTDENTFEITGCLAVLLKIVGEVELLVPSYGYALIPDCHSYADEVCSGFLGLSLFPSSNT